MEIGQAVGLEGQYEGQQKIKIVHTNREVPRTGKILVG